MSLAAFPSTISQVVEQQGYGEQPQTDLANYQPDSGAPLLRRRSLLLQDVIGCAMSLSSSEYDTLLSFYHTTLLDGSQRFTWVHPRTGTAAVFQFEGDGPKIASVSGPTYAISFSLRLISGGTYAGIGLDADVGTPLGYDTPVGDDLLVTPEAVVVVPGSYVLSLFDLSDMRNLLKL